MLKTAALLSVSVWFAQFAIAEPLQGGVEARQVQWMAERLPEGPFAFGPKIEDRAAWERIGKTKAYGAIVKEAEKLAATTMPALTEDVYLEYKRTGERTRHYSEVRGGRHGRIKVFTLAECVENKGRFIKPLEGAIAEICGERTWVFNFHDGLLDNWNGKIVGIDLGAVGPAHDMAQAAYLLGDHLSPETRALMEKECRRRILEPYRRAVEGAKEPWGWWITTENNWNAVCHNGVVGTALVFGRNREERAWHVAAAEKYGQNYIRGFGPDGYCAEGMGYWSYGFSNFVQLSELLWQASDGRLDAYRVQAVRLVAMYPPRLEIMNGVWPAYADCVFDARPSAVLMSFLNARYAFGLKDWEMSDFTTTGGSLASAMMFSWPNSATQGQGPGSKGFYELRTQFEHGGVLTCRPVKGSACRVGLSIKGGYNAEPHNHNDLGSFVVVVDDQALLVDPGGEVYTARTFGKRRYESKLLNSYGHPVPVVARRLQSAGSQFRAVITSTEFTDTKDTLVMDLKGAYEAPAGLTKLDRTFRYDRAGSGSVVVEDSFGFEGPESFATALLTYGQFKQVGADELLISQKGKAVRVRIDTGGRPFTIAGETIDERTHSKQKPTRIGITLSEPAGEGKLSMTIEPVDTAH